MEGINSDASAKNPASSSALNPKGAFHDKKTVAGNNLQKAVLNTNLSNLSEVAFRIDSSSPDLRPDAITHARALLSDPNWLSESNLDQLASKIIQEEAL